MTQAHPRNSLIPWLLLLAAVFLPAAQARAGCAIPPVAIADQAELIGSLAVIDVLANDTAPDNEALEVQVLSGGCSSLGTLTVLGSVVSYRPHPGPLAPCSFTYRVTAESGLSSTAAVSVAIPPVIFSDGFESGNVSAWSVSVP